MRMLQTVGSVLIALAMSGCSLSGNVAQTYVTTLGGGNVVARTVRLSGMSPWLFLFPPGPGENLGMTTGPDGKMWFTREDTFLCSDGNHRVANVTMEGQFFELRVSQEPIGIVAGPDGAMWFVEWPCLPGPALIGRVTVTGSLTEYPIASGSSFPQRIAAGNDRHLWFTDKGTASIGRVSTNGRIVEYKVPGTGSFPLGIAAGPDGNVWFTDFGTDKIGRITPNGTMTFFPLAPGSQPDDIVVAGDKNFYVTEYGTHKIAQVTTTGAVAEYTAPAQFKFLTEICRGPDAGSVWFTDSDVVPGDSRIGRFDLRTHRFSRALDPPHAPALPPVSIYQLHFGPDGNLWSADINGSILVYKP